MNAFITFAITYPAVPVVLFLAPMLAYRWFALPRGRKHTEWLLVATLWVMPAGSLCMIVVNFMDRFRPLKYDLYAYHIDKCLGLGNFYLGQVTAQHPWIFVTESVSYGLLPIAMLAAFACVLLWESESSALSCARTLLANLFLALPIYFLFPVCGPAFAFPSFPQVPADVPHLLALSAAPNGVPSVHTSTAILVWWFLRKWRAGRIFGGIFLCLTILATLGSGQHYAFDLFCAVPYALAVLYVNGELRSPESVSVPVLAHIESLF